MSCLKEEAVKKCISDNDCTWLEYNLGGWNVGEQTQASQQSLGQKVVKRHHCSVCSVC